MNSRKMLLALLVFGILLIVGCAGETSGDATAYFNQGVVNVEASDLEQALADYT
jgi:hypothetical protein